LRPGLLWRLCPGRPRLRIPPAAPVELAHILPRTEATASQPLPKPRPVIYNSGSHGDERQRSRPDGLAEKAAALGVDRFVMDDGWFGQRKTDHAGLATGPSTRKNSRTASSRSSTRFTPGHGLRPVGRTGDGEPDSDLYRAHPDWVLNFPASRSSSARNSSSTWPARRARLCVRIPRQAAQRERHRLLKWDYNRNWSEPGWDQLPPPSRSSLRRVHAQPLRHPGRVAPAPPKVEIESCSGGGAASIWAFCAIPTRSGLGQHRSLRPAHAAGRSPTPTPRNHDGWVTDSPHWLNHRATSLPYRMMSSMQARWASAPIFQVVRRGYGHAKRLIAAYHQVQTTIVQGDLYRLISPATAANSRPPNPSVATARSRWSSPLSIPHRKATPSLCLSSRAWTRPPSTPSAPSRAS